MIILNLTIDVVEEKDYCVVKLHGEIDVYTAPKLKKEILPLTEQKGNKVKIDLEHINYLDSTGLGVFISAYKSTKENDGELKLIHVRDRVLRLFKVTGLHEIMAVDEKDRGE
ncbi:STAS domain-containing protein [Pseudogracilibacillus sp. SO30301A]|uniref:STAS domain-containing protein n=1 Tax=Pseudogracilibacillus sp. SO30301A TaxID=3098291 RepID=UPI00300E2FB3